MINQVCERIIATIAPAGMQYAHSMHCTEIRTYNNPSKSENHTKYPIHLIELELQLGYRYF